MKTGSLMFKQGVLLACIFILSILAGCQSRGLSMKMELTDQQRLRAAEFLPDSLRAKVKNAHLAPNWIENQPGAFWYESDESGQTFHLVDGKPFEPRLLFDPVKLANALGKKTLNWHLFPLSRVSYDGESLHFSFEQKQYLCVLATYDCSRVEAETEFPDTLSPDRRYFVKVVNFNIVLCRFAKNDKHECRQLTKDGSESHPYAVTHPYPESKLRDPDHDQQDVLEVFWSNNSKYAISYRLHRAGVNRLTLTDSAADDDYGVNTVDYYYPQAGDAVLPAAELVLIDVNAQTAKALDAPHLMQTYYGGPIWGYWHQNAFYYHDRRRGNREYYLRKVLPDEHRVQTLILDTDEEFIDPWSKSFRLLAHTNRLIWSSQRSGYQHLYLYNRDTGQLLNAITSGEFTVRAIRGVDEEQGVLYFEASGREEHRDPYLRHLYRVNLDGSGLTLLTPEAFEHDTRVSPDFRIFVDTYSDHQTPPVSVVRSTRTGEVLKLLQRANADALYATGWQPPQAFSVLADDGVTPLYGLLYFPTDFDPSKPYAVIDDTYTGPHNFFTPKSFNTYSNQRSALAELGFIVFKMDGRGTSKRGKAFHRTSYKNLAGGTDDHKWAITQLAKNRPYLDLKRVGIFGFSAGGYDTVQAMLRHPDFYKVGVSASGNHDFRVDKAGWNEIWMGWPVTTEWHQQSNYYRVDRLKGKLLLGHGELDSNVHPSATLRLVDELIKANKEFDFLLMPKMGHVLDDSPYWVQKRWRFFLEHL